ncbi:response regulator [Oscillatoria salina]|uniref:response regulator n=1 Tax=Oscillatoria salina TaxID=331517 RepID=UPI0013B6CC0D|nr:response regulator [Oscillatoria salina]MBZ8182178.1 response regulator [Oscillatoria salina IIICB1]NET90223.1 response regulator [Kamptonema sp. SIO1D9]
MISDPPELRSLKILLVEDTPVNRQLLVNQLMVLGYQADCVSNGVAALNRLTKQDYDLILMDCIMPVLDGYLTTEALRARESNSRRTIVVAMTANISPGERQKCLAAGMDDYLSKPIQLEILATILARWSSVLGVRVPESCHSVIENYNLADDQQQIDRPILPMEVSTESELPSPERGEIPVELARLRELSRGDLEFELEMLQAFVEDAPVYLEQIRQAISTGDLNSLALTAHQLKGAAMTVAIYELPERAKQLENLAVNNCLEKARELLAECERIVDEVHNFLADLVQTEKSSRL